MKNTKLEELIIRMILTNERITQLHKHITKYPDDQDLVSSCLHYCMIDLSTFIETLHAFKKLVTADKKQRFDAMEPLIEWLCKYKRGIRRYRSKKVAHMDDLGNPSIRYFMKYTMPWSVSDFERIFSAVRLLSDYIELMYIREAEAISKKAEKEALEIEAEPDIVHQYNDMFAIREQIAQNIKSLDPPLDHIQYDYFMLLLDSLK